MHLLHDVSSTPIQTSARLPKPEIWRLLAQIHWCRKYTADFKRIHIAALKSCDNWCRQYRTSYQPLRVNERLPSRAVPASGLYIRTMGFVLIWHEGMLSPENVASKGSAPRNLLYCCDGWQDLRGEFGAIIICRARVKLGFRNQLANEILAICHFCMFTY